MKKPVWRTIRIHKLVKNCEKSGDNSAERLPGISFDDSLSIHLLLTHLCRVILSIRAVGSCSVPFILQRLKKDKTRSIKTVCGIKMSFSDD